MEPSPVTEWSAAELEALDIPPYEWLSHEWHMYFDLTE
jgi:hypothetical protein